MQTRIALSVGAYVQRLLQRSQELTQKVKGQIRAPAEPTVKRSRIPYLCLRVQAYLLLPRIPPASSFSIVTASYCCSGASLRPPLPFLKFFERMLEAYTCGGHSKNQSGKTAL
jgi:hypothetical protein